MTAHVYQCVPPSLTPSYNDDRKSIYENNSHSRYDVPPFFDIMNIPLTTILRIHIGSPGNSIYLTCKDYRSVCITLSAFERDKNFVDMVYHTLLALSFYTNGNNTIYLVIYISIHSSIHLSIPPSIHFSLTIYI